MKVSKLAILIAGAFAGAKMLTTGLAVMFMNRLPTTAEVAWGILFTAILLMATAFWANRSNRSKKSVILVMRQHDHGMSALEIKRIGSFDENVYRTLRSLERRGYLISPESHAIRGWTPHIVYELAEKGRTTDDF